MEIATPGQSDSLSGSFSLTELDSSKDNFETCLIQLLQVYTANQRGPSSSPSSTGSTPQPFVGGLQAYTCLDISPESLNSLSSEQVSTLVTSNSVNYEVIHQIMSQKQGYHGIPRGMGGAFGMGGGNNGDSYGSLGSSGQSSRQQTPEVASPRPVGPGGGEGGIGAAGNKGSSSSLGDAPLGSPSSGQGQSLVGTKNPLPQITPEHLQLLQQQVTDLLRSKQVSLPAEMTSQQQQMLIQSVLLKQLNLQQEQLKEKSGGGGGSISSEASLSNPAANEGAAPMTTAATASTSTATTVPTDSLKEKGTMSSSPLSLEGLLSSKPLSQQEKKGKGKEKVHCI